MSLPELGDALDDVAKRAANCAREIGDAAAMVERFKVDVGKFDVDMSVFRQHAGQTVDEFNIALNQLGGLKLALDGTEPKLKALDTSSKEAQETLKALTDLMEKKFPDVAHDYIENYRFIIQNVLSGSESITDALGQLEALQAMLNRMGLKPGQMGQLNDFTNMFKQLLDMLRRLQDKARP